MTLLGKIFTVLIFIMSVAFCILAVATFATHRNWKETATAHAATISKLNQQYADKVTELELQKNMLAVERAARRAALATLQAKLVLVANDVRDYSNQLTEKTSQLTSQTQAAKDAEALLTDITAEVNKLREEIRITQQDRDNQFTKAVTLTDKLNQSQSLKERLEEQHRQLQEQYAQLNHIAERSGIDLNTLVSAIPPPLDGKVTAIDEANGLVEVSLGADDGLKRGHTLQVYRGTKYLGEIILRQVNPDKSVGEIDKKMQRGRMQKDDNVTTKLS